jgi:hypothetical protein
VARGAGREPIIHLKHIWGATVVHDGAAANLEFGGTTVPGATVHRAFMAALAGGYAAVVDADTLLTGAATETG